MALNMKKFALLAGFAAFVIGCSSSMEPEVAAEEPKGTDSTFPQVMALIESKCVSCHGEKGAEGIDLRSHASIMKGGEHGPIVSQGDPEGSAIVQVLRGTDGKKQMPLNAAPLSESEIALIEEWVRNGAKS